MNKLTLTDFEKNTENPFLKQAIEEIQKSLVKKYKTASSTDRRAILQAYDPDTGEVLGHTQFIRQVEVDEQKFAKLYLSRFSSFFDLKPQAIRVFGYILTQLQTNKDDFIFDREECKTYTGYKSDKSIFIGLASLLSCEVIARGKTDYRYYINPMVAFNGNRVTFADTFIRKQKKKEITKTKLPELPFVELEQDFGGNDKN